jgi:hypothetical protein
MLQDALRGEMSESIFRRRSLGDLRDPLLLRSLRTWQGISDAKGRFHLGRSMDPIFRNPGLLLPASTLSVVGGSDPRDFIIAWQGPEARIAIGSNMTGRRFSDLAEKAYVEEVSAQFVRAITEAEIAYDEVIAHVAGRMFHYDRLLYPVLWRGAVDQLLTVTRLRTPIRH